MNEGDFMTLLQSGLNRIEADCIRARVLPAVLFCVIPGEPPGRGILLIDPSLTQRDAIRVVKSTVEDIEAKDGG